MHQIDKNCGVTPKFKDGLQNVKSRYVAFLGGDDYRLLLFVFIVLKLILSLLPIHYGIFRDEFYYLSMSNRLDFGYVDVPPLAPFLLAINRFLFGDSFFSLHLLPAVSGTLFLWLAYRLAKTLGGNCYAMFLTLLAVLLAPIFIASDAIYTYDTFNKLFWLLFTYLMIRLVQTENPRYWLYLGIAAGFGLMFKITLLILGFGWITALLLTKKRRLLWHWEAIGAAALVLAIFSPYLVWEFQHGFISLEYYRNYNAKLNDFSLSGYLIEQIIYLNPATLPVWLAGLYFLCFNREGKTFRIAVITYMIILLLSYFKHAKPDLITPFYVLLLAAGSVWIEKIFAQKYWGWLRVGIIGLVIVVGIFVLPMARPVLPVKTFIQIYGRFNEGNVERHQLGQLPQFYADRFGWEELTAKIAKVYWALPAEERIKTCIFVGNYGEAGAIEFYGKRYSLPLPPLSGHNQYYVWGPSRFDGQIMIVAGLPYDWMAGKFDSVEKVSVFTNSYVMPYENNLTIYVCRRPSEPLSRVKPWFKWLN